MSGSGLPKHIKIGGLWYECTPLSALTRDSRTLGTSCGNRLDIRIDSSIPRQNQETALLHEIIEQVDYRYQLGLEHAQTCTLETALYQVLRDNPEVVAFILDRSGERETSEGVFVEPSPAPEEPSEGERCQACGRRYDTVWRAPDSLWARVSGEAGTLCPKCFDEKARALGISLYWECAEGEYPSVPVSVDQFYEDDPTPAEMQADLDAAGVRTTEGPEPEGEPCLIRSI